MESNESNEKVKISRDMLLPTDGLDVLPGYLATGGGGFQYGLDGVMLHTVMPNFIMDE